MKPVYFYVNKSLSFYFKALFVVLIFIPACKNRDYININSNSQSSSQTPNQLAQLEDGYSVNLCANGTAVCAGANKIIFTNQILTGLGKLDLIKNSDSKELVDGFQEVDIYNPYSKRRGFIKIRYLNGNFEISKNEKKTQYDFMCYDHSKGKCDFIPEFNTINCDSSINAYDGEKVITLRSNPEVAQKRACGGTPLNLEVINEKGLSVPYADLDLLFKGCRCQLAPDLIKQLSDSLVSHYTSSMRIRTSIAPSDCVDVEKSWYQKCSLEY